MSEPQQMEVRTKDNRLFCRAKLIHGDILLIVKSAGKEIELPYTEIPKLISAARNQTQKKLLAATEETTKAYVSP